ncbi:MAG: GNAT family N-acetyltransferase [Myxococcales bacterium]
MTALEQPTLSGTHVRLEPLSLQHLDDLVGVARGPRETYRLTFVPEGPEAMRTYIQTALSLRDAGAAVPFATVRLADGRVVGSTRFGNLEYWAWPAGARSPPAPPDAVEIGWTWLAADAQRTAINTEAKLLMLAHAFERWHVRRVNLRTDARNVRSRTAIERLGAKLDGILRAHMPAADGGVRDTASYSIVAEEWPAAKERLSKKL